MPVPTPTVLTDLVALLRLERIEENLFRGQSQDLGWGAIFGGQVVGQALSAASHTVPADRMVHSLHGYFLRVGDATRPVVYQVDCSRDGRSFTTRRVVAIQSGRPIFHMAASFQIDEPGYDHQAPTPRAPDPETLISERDLALAHVDRIPAHLQAMALRERPIEVRQVDPGDPLSPQIRPPGRQVWYRAAERLPDDPALHRFLLAYASDFHFLGTALQPHGVSWFSGDVQMASLDHAMWFHRPFRLDDWLLYEIDSPSASGARGLVRGSFYDRGGALVASVAQEGLIRQRDHGRGGA